MPTGPIGRAPDAETRVRRAIDQMADIWNDLIAGGFVQQGTGGNWIVVGNRTSPQTPPEFCRPGRRPRPFFFPGIQGATGATGATGPAGSSGSGGVPSAPYIRRHSDTWTPPGGISGVTPVLSGSASQFLNGQGKFTTPSTGGGVGWDLQIVSTADQDVTNSTTFTDHTELQHTVTAGSIWYYHAWILYSGDTTGSDCKMTWACSAGTYTGYHLITFLYNNSDAFLVSNIRTLGGTAWGTGQSFGTDAAHTLRFGEFRQAVQYSNDCTASFQFAQNVAGGAGTEARIRTGSTLLGRRIL